MSAAVLATLARLQGDLPAFAQKNLKIMPKRGGQPIPFTFNEAQIYTHEQIEQQRNDTGMVRAIILKGRQQGISTYTAARYYHQCSMQFGKKAYIIAHEQAASDNLFGLVKRYHENNPLAPHTGFSNAKELIFDRMDSGYKVATAGTKDVGRSATSQLVHASEFGFWQNAELHIAGLGQTVAEAEGTEIIIESTANGVGNVFHEYWQLAESGENGYLPIFVPWFWQPEYATAVPKTFDLSGEDQAYMRAYGLTLEQMAWRAKKIASFGKGRGWLFKQEYPACPAESFVSATADPFVSPELVHAAVNSGYLDRAGPLVIGVDPAEFGADRTALVFRRGRVVFRIERYKGKDTMEVAGIVAARIKEFHPDAVFIDAIGIGAGVRDRLKELGFTETVGVKSGQRAQDDDTYANKRAEMWGNMRAWLADAPCRMPNDAELLSDIVAPQYRYDSSGRLLIEKKDDMKKRGVRSPDCADALALTFAEPVVPRGIEDYGLPFAGGQRYQPASSAGY